MQSLKRNVFKGDLKSDPLLKFWTDCSYTLLGCRGGWRNESPSKINVCSYEGARV